MEKSDEWRKSSYSAGYGACVEVSLSSSEVLVRDSKWGNLGEVLRFSRESARVLIQVAKTGVLDRT